VKACQQSFLVTNLISPILLGKGYPHRYREHLGQKSIKRCVYSGRIGLVKLPHRGIWQLLSDLNLGSGYQEPAFCGHRGLLFVSCAALFKAGVIITHISQLSHHDSVRKAILWPNLAKACSSMGSSIKEPLRLPCGLVLPNRLVKVN
jgi:hypothetical protein